ncbi:MAG: hypothetical protein AAF940_13350 [Pseudomonadota bacterium]
MKLKIAIFGLLLIGCAAEPMPEGQIIPMKSIIADARERPFECDEYSIDDDTCTGIVERRFSGGSVFMDAKLQDRFPNTGLVSITLKTTFDVRETSFCGDYSDVEITARAPNFLPHVTDRVVDQMERDLKGNGVGCSSYLRDTEGRVYVVSRDSSGAIQGPADQVWFFANPKELSR